MNFWKECIGGQTGINRLTDGMQTDGLAGFRWINGRIKGIKGNGSVEGTRLVSEIDESFSARTDGWISGRTEGMDEADG